MSRRRPPPPRESTWTYAALRAAARCTKCGRPSVTARCPRCAAQLSRRRYGGRAVRRVPMLRVTPLVTTAFCPDADRREELLALSEISALWRVR